MDNENRALNFIFAGIVIAVLALSAAAIPDNNHVSNTPTETVSQKPSEVKSDQDLQAHKAPETHQPEKIQEPPETPAASKSHAVESSSPEKSSSLSIIKMNNPEYPAHKKPIVSFTHEKHYTQYQIACGTCHHDQDGEPIDLKPGDPVESCIECHTETVKEKGEKLSKEEKIQKYHFEALHANCIECHKAHNIAKGDPKGKKPAPAGCSDCHAK